ncbi:protein MICRORCHIDIA 7 [Cucumis melo]|nr:protein MICRORCHIDIA 7 [Cucumis melo]
METSVKQELIEPLPLQGTINNHEPSNFSPTFIELSSDSESDSEDSEQEVVDGVLGVDTRSVVLPNDVDGGLSKKRRLNELEVVKPLGFLPPASLDEKHSMAVILPPSAEAGNGQEMRTSNANGSACKQFWKAGDYEGAPCSNWDSSSGGMDHVRVHPKFLHSNATSHKWALGAFAELLDNSLDEVSSGATHVNIDMLVNKKDRTKMLLIEDNGGGMSPDKMRHCMSLGYSEKTKLADTIGQYGNGFKTSTMRLGADVIVFSRCCGQYGKSGTQSIGLLSYTFLRSTGKEDIVVPMLDYERKGGEWVKIVRSSLSDWNKNVETVAQWSPFANEAELLRQFYLMKDHGTRIIIYNLWEDDQGQLELDFDTDPHDIQIRGVNRDEKSIQMAKKFPNSRHFLTYRHSLRSYASILYLRLPPGFRIILRGRDVEHHNIVNDMMMSQEVTYRPQPGADGAGTVGKDTNMVAVVTIGFVKDAKHHIDVQGFNVYHKNRLIKPFWRLWNASGSDGRGVIGVLEANFVEPAHDKQGFERTTVLARLEARLIQMQKTYWGSYCHKIGYAPRRIDKPNSRTPDRESSPDDYSSQLLHQSKRKSTSLSGKKPDKVYLGKETEKFQKTKDFRYGNMHSSKDKNSSMTPDSEKLRTRPSSSEPPSPSGLEVRVDNHHGGQANGIGNETFHGNDVSMRMKASSNGGVSQAQQGGLAKPKGGDTNDSERSPSSSDLQMLQQLKEENEELKERLKRKEADHEKLQDERERRCKSLESQLKAAELKIEELNKEQESLIDIFSEERDRRETEERNLRKKLQEASNTIQELLDKIKILEKR